MTPLMTQHIRATSLTPYRSQYKSNTSSMFGDFWIERISIQ